MSSNRHAKQAKAYLEELCRAIDRKEPFVRRRAWWKGPAAVPAAVGLVVTLSGCGSEHHEQTPAYAAPGATVETCDNDVDDDGDGKVDCADADCARASGCEGQPPSEYCDNQVDDDGDGKVDCADEDCDSYAGCTSAEYAAPFENCDNQLDDDGDGEVDCADEDCADDPICLPGPAYMAPIEDDCENEIDDDGDGKVDCEDADCESFPGCMSADYAAPFSQ